MKKFLIFLALFLFVYPVNLSAHVVKSENKIGALMHIEPGDQPFSGEPSTIILEFKDTEGLFSLESCLCNLAIYSGEEKLSENSLTFLSDSDKLVSGTNFVFPKSGSYKIKVTGEPKDESSHESFEFSYDVSVSQKAQSPEPSATPKAADFSAGEWIS